MANTCEAFLVDSAHGFHMLAHFYNFICFIILENKKTITIGDAHPNNAEESQHWERSKHL